jgi:hypothetical protein
MPGAEISAFPAKALGPLLYERVATVIGAKT